jgi:uncharacterized small protein (DUF1192 family)
MPLILQPTFNELTRQEVEAHLQTVRARRMIAAMELVDKSNARLGRVSEVLSRRIDQQRGMLEKEIGRLDAALQKVENRLAALTELFGEQGQVIDQIKVVGSDSGEEWEDNPSEEEE